MSLKSPAAILAEAALHIEARGWCQGELKDAGGRICVLKALNNACRRRSPHTFREAISELARRIGGNLDGSSIADWNDARGRTKEEVLSVLRGE